MPAVPHVRVGVAAFVLRAPNDSLLSSFILMGKRLGSHGSGTWALPGGHIEHGETFEECITREIMEETGLSVKNVRFLTATNDIMPVEAKHYVTIFMVCEREAANGAQEREPEVKEPEKCEGWKWVSWGELLGWVGKHGEGSEGEGRKLFLPLVNLVRQRPGVRPTDGDYQ